MPTRDVVFEVKLNSYSGDQAELIQCLRSAGLSVIQTGSGLCVKGAQGHEKLQACLAQVELAEGTAIIPINRARADSYPKDVQAFLAS